MFITNKLRYSGQQVFSGKFLILFCNESQELRALVRFVSMSQLGHFMMGRATIGKFRITVSGSYGNDGLPRSVYMPTDKHADIWKDKHEESIYIWSRAVKVPDELAKEYWKGGGHNSSGSEADNMRKWALANLEKLTAKPVKTLTHHR